MLLEVQQPLGLRKRVWICDYVLVVYLACSLHKKWNFSVKAFFSRCEQICSCLWICLHLLEKFLTKILFFCSVFNDCEKKTRFIMSLLSGSVFLNRKQFLIDVLQSSFLKKYKEAAYDLFVFCKKFYIKVTALATLL